jgi:hypothetical protein
VCYLHYKIDASYAKKETRISDYFGKRVFKKNTRASDGNFWLIGKMKNIRLKDRADQITDHICHGFLRSGSESQFW